jgi:peptidylprolyl isomerase
MSSITKGASEKSAEAAVKAYPKAHRQHIVASVGKPVWKEMTWAQRLETLKSTQASTNTTTTGETKTATGGPGTSKTCGDKPRCYICVDIDDARAKFARCQDFVEKRSLAYNLSSPKLSELGGSERARLPEIFANDWEWSQKGDILLDLPEERIVVELDRKKAPLAVENFVALITGEKGVGKSGKALHYVGCPFHRIIGEFVAQSGDILTGTGAGGESIYGKKFKDDREALKVQLGKRGQLAMCNTGKNTNTSQFFFSLGPGTKKLSGKHVVFGHIVEGEHVLDLIENVAGGSDVDGKPTASVIIAECGLL